MNSLTNIFVYSLLAGTATVMGSLFVLYRAGIKRINLYGLMAFASGVLLGAAFLHLIPEAMEQAGRPAAWGLAIGFAAFFSLEQITFSHACPEYCQDCRVRPMGLAAFVALSLHSLVDGLALAAGYSRKKSLVLSLVVALATPLGALVAYPGVTGIAESILALLLGIAAGSFLYVGATDILPQLHRQQVRGTFTLFIVGMGLMLLSVFFRIEV